MKYLVVSKNEGLLHIVRVYINQLSSNPPYAAQLSCSAISRLVKNRELKRELLKGSSTDSMGRSTIVYWPRVTCNDAEDED